MGRRCSLSILDVGHGSCAVLIDVNGVVVFDAGPGTSLLEFLLQETITVIDVLLISHADKDHIEGIISLLESRTIDIKLIRLNTDSEKESKLWDDLLYVIEQTQKAGRLKCEVGLCSSDSGKFNVGTIGIEILAPSPYIAAKGPGGKDRRGRRLSGNSVCTVIRLVREKNPIAILPGDIDDVGIENLAESGQDPTAPIALFPHHGAKPGGHNMVAFARRFCNLVNSTNIIFSIGRGQYGTPQPEILASIRETLPKARILCTQLSEHCATDLPVNYPSHLTGQYSRGREEQKCCAGTIFIPLDDSALSILPVLEDHVDFIQKVSSKALCITKH
jgi:beta-lactamase superfamily II metal-dependent hydrolase